MGNAISKPSTPSPSFLSDTLFDIDADGCELLQEFTKAGWDDDLKINAINDTKKKKKKTVELIILNTL